MAGSRIFQSVSSSFKPVAQTGVRLSALFRKFGDVFCVRTSISGELEPKKCLSHGASPSVLDRCLSK